MPNSLTELTEKLNEVETRRTVALNDNLIGVWELDVVNRLIIWDQTMLDIYGVSELEFQGKYHEWVDALHPDDVARTEAELNKALYSSQHKFYHRFRIKSGTGWSWVIGVGTAYFEDGLPKTVIGVNLLEPVDPYSCQNS